MPVFFYLTCFILGAAVLAGSVFLALRLGRLVQGRQAARDRRDGLPPTPPSA
jgi:hypothetical protein